MDGTLLAWWSCVHVAVQKLGAVLFWAWMIKTQTFLLEAVEVNLRKYAPANNYGTSKTTYHTAPRRSIYIVTSYLRLGLKKNCFNNGTICNQMVFFHIHELSSPTFTLNLQQYRVTGLHNLQNCLFEQNSTDTIEHSREFLGHSMCQSGIRIP